jgi:hypothetical protein
MLEKASDVLFLKVWDFFGLTSSLAISLVCVFWFVS